MSVLKIVGDPTQYLGDVSVNNTMLQFSSYQKLSNWSNMQVYTYHSYGKPGQTQVNDYQYLVKSVQASNPTNKNIPVIITEHNSHTSSDWSTFNSTPDDTFEASRLASQIINLISTNTFTSHFVFKFSVTPSNIAGV